MKQNFCQKGRTLVETLGVIVLMAIISIALYAIFQLVLDKANARTLEQEVQARVVQLKHRALLGERTNKEGVKKESIKVEAYARVMEASGFAIRTSAVDDATFTLRVGLDDVASASQKTKDTKPLDYSLCRRLMKSATFNPENLDACHKSQKYADFVFPKFSGLKKFSDNVEDPGLNEPELLDCDDNAHQSGDRCACNAGYYGNGEVCTQCGDRQYSDEDASSCETCPAGQTHNLGHTDCQDCPASTTLGECGCDTDKAPDGKGECTDEFCSSDEECNSEDACMACVKPDGKTGRICQFACTYKEYLQSNGSQYIDTGVKPSPGLVFSGRAMFTSFSDWNVLFGSVVEDDRYEGIIFRQGGDSTPSRLSVWFCGMPGSSTTGYNYGQFNIGRSSVNYLFDFSLSAGSASVGGSSYTFPVSTGNLTNRNKNTIYLFGGNYYGIWRRAPSRIYKMTITNSGGVVRDFVPVLDTKDIPAMYDKKEKKLYYNRGGSQFTTN